MATTKRIEKRRNKSRNGHSVACWHANKHEKGRFAHYDLYVCCCSKEKK